MGKTKQRDQAKRYLTHTWTAEKISVFREQQNISQQQMAELLGVNITTISRWENGHFRVSNLGGKRLDALQRRLEREVG